MFKLKVTYVTIGQEWEGLFETNQAALDWLADQVDKPNSIDSVIEHEITDVTASEALRQRRDLKKTVGKIASNICADLKEIIQGENTIRKSNGDLNQGQINQIISNFSDIKLYLDNNNPLPAKPLIEAIVPDELLITSELKEDLLEVYSEYGI